MERLAAKELPPAAANLAAWASREASLPVACSERQSGSCMS